MHARALDLQIEGIPQTHIGDIDIGPEGMNQAVSHLQHIALAHAFDPGAGQLQRVLHLTQGDTPVGTLTSDVFMVAGNQITFLIGGGCDIYSIYVELLVDGASVAKHTGKCMEKMAGLVKKLEAVPEGDGTMMDNTLIVYLSDSAEGHHPRCNQWPFVILGDLGGRLNLGNRYISYPWYGKTGHRTIANLYLSFLHALGDRRQTFGLKDNKLMDLDQDGPLAEIMV